MLLSTQLRPHVFNNNLLNLFDEAQARNNSWSPAVDIEETEDAYFLTIDVPGVSDENIDISAKESTLKVKGVRNTKEQQEGVKTHQIERLQGEFTRTFKLPTSVDIEVINANKKDGVLIITLPKKAVAQAKKITIN